MLTAEARIETDRASRYLVQACRHFTNQGRHMTGLAARHMAAAARHGGAPSGSNPAAKARIEYSDTDGMIDFGWGRCTLQATPAALTLRAEAADEDNLQHVREILTGHIERFGRRDHITVTWRQTQAPGTGAALQS
jgi:hypothetical protein